MWNFLPSIDSIVRRSISKKLSLCKYENRLDGEFPALSGIINKSLPVSILKRHNLEIGFEVLRRETHEIYKIINSIGADVVNSYENRLYFPFYISMNKDIEALILPYEVTFEKLTNFNNERIPQFENQLAQFKMDAAKEFPAHKEVINNKLPNKITADVHRKAYQWLMSQIFVLFKDKLERPRLTTIKEVVGLSHKAFEYNDTAYAMIGLIDSAKELFINSRLQEISETWLLDNINTTDDLLALLEIVRLLKKGEEKPQELESVLQKLQGRPVTYKNLILTVETSFILDKKNKPLYKVNFSLKFTVDDAAWHFHTTIDNKEGLLSKPWQFEKYDKTSHDDDFSFKLQKIYAQPVDSK